MGQVPDHDHVETVQPADLALDGVEVEQRLGGVLAGTVPGVDHRDRRDRRRPGRGPLLEVPEHDAIRVSGHDPHRVLQGLTLDRGGEVPGVLSAHHLTSQAEHG